MTAVARLWEAVIVDGLGRERVIRVGAVSERRAAAMVAGKLARIAERNAAELERLRGPEIADEERAALMPGLEWRLKEGPSAVDR